MYTEKDKKLAERILYMSTIPLVYQGVTISTIEQECDTLSIQYGFDVQKSGDEHIVWVPIYTPATRCEPEDTNFKESSRFPTLVDALTHCAFLCLKQDIDNTLEADAEASAYNETHEEV